jgi:hypothetical protein
LKGIAARRKEMYVEILRHLRDVVRCKRPEKWTTAFGFSLRTTLQHTGQYFFVKDFLTKNNVTTLEHPPHSRDLPAFDFYLFP